MKIDKFRFDQIDLQHKKISDNVGKESEWNHHNFVEKLLN